MAVEQSHHALDYGNIPRRRRFAVQLQGGGVGQQPGIKVAGWDAAGQLVVGGVDVVGAGLEGLHGVAAAGERAHNAGGDGGFAHAATNPGDYYCRVHWWLLPVSVARIFDARFG